MEQQTPTNGPRDLPRKKLRVDVGQSVILLSWNWLSWRNIDDLKEKQLSTKIGWLSCITAGYVCLSSWTRPSKRPSGHSSTATTGNSDPILSFTLYTGGYGIVWHVCLKLLGKEQVTESTTFKYQWEKAADDVLQDVLQYRQWSKEYRTRFLVFSKSGTLTSKKSCPPWLPKCIGSTDTWSCGGILNTLRLAVKHPKYRCLTFVQNRKIAGL